MEHLECESRMETADAKRHSEFFAKRFPNWPIDQMGLSRKTLALNESSYTYGHHIGVLSTGTGTSLAQLREARVSSMIFEQATQISRLNEAINRGISTMKVVFRLSLSIIELITDPCYNFTEMHFMDNDFTGFP